MLAVLGFTELWVSQADQLTSVWISGERCSLELENQESSVIHLIKQSKKRRGRTELSGNGSMQGMGTGSGRGGVERESMSRKECRKSQGRRKCQERYQMLLKGLGK